MRPVFPVTRALCLVALTIGGLSCTESTTAPEPPGTIDLDARRVSLLPLDTFQLGGRVLRASGAPAAGAGITWTSLDTSVVRVSTAGMLAAPPYAGALVRTTQVIARSDRAPADTVHVEVRPWPVHRVVASRDTVALSPTQSAAVTAVPQSVRGVALEARDVTWSSSDTAIARVSADGTVTAPDYRGPAVRTAQVVAAVEGAADTVIVVVSPVAAATARVTPSLAAVWIGRTQPFAVELRDRTGTRLDGRTVTWTSSDPTVAAVAPNGVVTGLAPGTVRITATADSAASTVTVDVFPEPQAAITITFDDAWRGVLQYAAPLLDSLRLRANVGWITHVDWPAMMSAADVQQLHDRGWAVVSHSMTHPFLTQLAPDSARAELVRSRARIDSLGFEPGVFIVPYLDYSDEVEAAVAQAGYPYARCCRHDTWTGDNLTPWPIPSAARHRLVGVDATNYDGVASTYNFRTPSGRAALRQLLERVVAERKFVDVFFHNVVPEDLPDLRLTMALLAEYRQYVITYSALPAPE